MNNIKVKNIKMNYIKINKYIINYLYRDKVSNNLRCFTTSRSLCFNEKFSVSSLRNWHFKTYCGRYKFVTPLQECTEISKKFLVLNFETYIDISHKVPVPYAIGITSYNKKKKLFIFSKISPKKYIVLLLKPQELDPQSWLIIVLKEWIFVPKNDKHVFWVHNDKKLNYYFLIEVLIKLGLKENLKILIQDGSWISIKVYFNLPNRRKTYMVEFRDSYKLLPQSLNDLAKAFDLKIQLDFDHFKINENNYFQHSDEIYKYLKESIEILYPLLENFQNKIYDNSKVDPLQCLSLSQVALRIFRTKYYKGDNKFLLSPKGKLYSFIKEACYNGHRYTDRYQSHVKCEHEYNINYLYPYCMTMDMPINAMHKWKLSYGLNCFGFLKAIISPPSHLKLPFLPRKINDKLKLDVNVWTGVYFSEELKYAETLGYQITIIEGLVTEKGRPFDEFIRDYVSKANSSGPEQIISTLILNSLYDNFGQFNDHFESFILDDCDLFKEIYLNYSYTIPHDFDSKNIFLTYSIKSNPHDLNTKKEYENIAHYNNTRYVTSSILIAAAITSYSRIEIDKYKRLDDLKVINSNRNSIIFDRPLPNEYVGNDLGQLNNKLSNFNK